MYRYRTDIVNDIELKKGAYLKRKIYSVILEINHYIERRIYVVYYICKYTPVLFLLAPLK